MRRAEHSIRKMVFTAACAAVMFAAQVALSALPNVELVSLLTVIYALLFGKDALAVIYLFVFLEGMLYGFGIWWLMYLYVWDILWLLARLFRNRLHKPIEWALLLCIYGLSFGALCTLVMIPVSGLKGAASWWIAGIPSDLVHAVGNFMMGFLLYRPLMKFMVTACRRFHIPFEDHNAVSDS